MKINMNFMCIALLSLLMMVGAFGCGDAGGTAKTNSPVRILVTDIATQMFESDVATYPNGSSSPSFEQDENVFTIRIEPVGASNDNDTYMMDVIITGFEVKYVRKDTGVEVPKTFTANCNVYCGLDEDTEVPVVFCRADQKQMPPLSYLWQFGYEPSTGLQIIHTTCIVTFWGRTNSGREVVSDPAEFTVNFADWAD